MRHRSMVARKQASQCVRIGRIALACAICLVGCRHAGTSLADGGAPDALALTDALVPPNIDAAYERPSGDAFKQDSAQEPTQDATDDLPEADLVDASLAHDASLANERPNSAPDAEPSCIQAGDLFFSRPDVLFVSGQGHRVLAATPDRRVAIGASWYGRPGVFYLDSLDGGRTFRPLLQLDARGGDNLQIAIGPSRVYVTSAVFGQVTSVLMWHAPLDQELRAPSQFDLIEFGPPNTYAGTPIVAADGRVAVFLANGSLATLADEGLLVSNSPAARGPFSEPHKVTWPGVCVGALYHSNGKLYLTYALSGVPARIEVRVSTDNGASFSTPVARNSKTQLDCPQVYEGSDHNLLLVTNEGFPIGPGGVTTTALRYDVSTERFTSETAIFPEPADCFDTARTAGGRLFVSSSEPGPGGIGRKFVLSHSDDGGWTWSAHATIPWMRPGEVCPRLAASNDEIYLLWSRGGSLMFGRAGGQGACQ